jgi:hypothetical protein
MIIQAVFLLILAILGFGAGGVVGGPSNHIIHLLFLSDIWYLLGSPAARYQSLCYGGNTPASSLFAILQSIGMKYHTVTLSNWVLATIRLLAGLLFVYVALGMTLWW